MSAKDIFFDFLNYVFITVLAIFCLLFFLDWDRFAAFTEALKGFFPLAVVGLIFLVKLKMSRRQLRRKKEEGDLELVLYLNYFDKLKSELLVFGSPLIVIIIAWAAGKVDLVDIFQAGVVFILLYAWQKFLFTKAR